MFLLVLFPFPQLEWLPKSKKIRGMNENHLFHVSSLRALSQLPFGNKRSQRSMVKMLHRAHRNSRRPLHWREHPAHAPTPTTSLHCKVLTHLPVDTPTILLKSDWVYCIVLQGSKQCSNSGFHPILANKCTYDWKLHFLSWQPAELLDPLCIIAITQS